MTKLTANIINQPLKMHTITSNHIHDAIDLLDNAIANDEMLSDEVLGSIIYIFDGVSHVNFEDICDLPNIDKEAVINKIKEMLPKEEYEAFQSKEDESIPAVLRWMFENGRSHYWTLLGFILNNKEAYEDLAGCLQDLYDNPRASKYKVVI